ncbi:hypothetical protein F444_10677 [Phytophthora nicotianae P1976]|uniref:Uncharacterized protein n=1 Tax=Phytophthora nicotianae P1976 TaxID=1317066 RepID=A0A081A3C0_PHYNI|nr:hypothetical protein F444_10677 [Phytophthora nicotianae P1976]
MTTEVSRLLVLGTDQDSNAEVISKLRALCCDADAEVSVSDVTLLNLQTKYYQAPVELHVHRVRDNTPEPALQHELHEYEAVMCVANTESFAHMHQLAKRIVDTLPYDVCLLVTSTSSATTKSVKKMETWCQDNGFELVDLDTEKVVSPDSVIDEKQGMERVLEALQCTMWRSMEMNPPKVETAAKSKEEATAMTEKVEKNEDIENQKENKADNDEQGGATDDTKLQALLQALEIAGDGGASGEGGEDDIDMAQFSALISEVRNVRDQGQSLTDEQRRERAAEVAMKLWTFLGADDGASDSD